MADKTITQLTAATTPLAGTEVLPIVQSSTTVKVATDNLTVKNIRSNATTGILQIAGPGVGATRTMTVPDANFTSARTDAAQSLTGDQTLSSGNIVFNTAAKGANFTANTPFAGMTSQLLNWYEEGTWTPTANGITYAAGTTGNYTRIGNLVTCTFNIVFPTTADGSAAQIQALPFISSVNSAAAFGGYSSGFNLIVVAANSYLAFINPTGTAFVVNSTLSTQNVIGSITYQV